MLAVLVNACCGISYVSARIYVCDISLLSPKFMSSIFNKVYFCAFFLHVKKIIIMAYNLMAYNLMVYNLFVRCIARMAMRPWELTKMFRG